MQLRAVSYKWKEPQIHKNFDKTQIGFIAQEVEKIIPELVDTDDQGYKSKLWLKIKSFYCKRKINRIITSFIFIFTSI